METQNNLDEKIKEELEVGFKKLNFALQSYNKEFKADLLILPNHCSFILNGPTGSMLTYKFHTIYEAFDNLTKFKKESIDICSHQKKERH